VDRSVHVSSGAAWAREVGRGVIGEVGSGREWAWAIKGEVKVRLCMQFFRVNSQRWLGRCSCARLSMLAYATFKEGVFTFFAETEVWQ
jgi:hypothetical protein